MQLLRDADDRTLSERAERLTKLISEGQPEQGRLLPGGPLGATAVWEAGAAYVHGFFLATLLLTQSALEHLLAGALVIHHPDRSADGRPVFAELLQSSRAAGLLTEGEFLLFDDLRRRRNPYAHARGINDRAGLLRRSMTSGKHPDEIIDTDAWSALQALVHLINRPPFALGAVRFSSAD